MLDKNTSKVVFFQTSDYIIYRCNLIQNDDNTEIKIYN
jgi:hypothetical protein